MAEPSGGAGSDRGYWEGRVKTVGDGLDRMRPVVFFLALGFAVVVVARTAVDAARERERVERWVRGASASGGSDAAGAGCSCRPGGNVDGPECHRTPAGVGPGRTGEVGSAGSGT